MSTWQDVLKDMTRARSLERARSMVAKGTVYKLGKGGFKPQAELWSTGKTADCSGFVAWVLGIPRELPPGSGHWLQTTTYWEGGGFSGFAPFPSRPLTQAMPGDLLVFPDSGTRQGHMGIVTKTDQSGPTAVIHCSKGNFTSTGDAIRETSPQVFLSNTSTRLVHVDFAELRAAAGVTGAPGGDEETPAGEVVPFPIGGLRSLTLSSDASLRLVASGMLTLEATDERMGGIRMVQAALAAVNGGGSASAGGGDGGTADMRSTDSYEELGDEPGDGIFGERTARALTAFQKRMSLEPTGALDAETLRALDDALLGGLGKVVTNANARPSAAAPAPPPPQPVSPLPVVTRRDGSQFFARVGDSPEFFVGRRVTFLGKIGLMNTSRPGNAIYAAQDHVGQFGHFAHLIEPTAMCEGSGFFDRINTYDRARFTFGFLQFAAHNAESDFVKYFRRLIALPLAAAYFPDLTLVNGRIASVANGQTTPLETSSSTEKLMDYLNPDSQEVQEKEVINCAKLIHWCASDAAHREAQVEGGIDEIRDALKRDHRRYDLNGRTDVTCLIIFDIHHQGRARVVDVRAALERATTEQSAWEELLDIGLPTHKERLETLREHIMTLMSAGILGSRRYRAATNDFA